MMLGRENLLKVLTRGVQVIKVFNEHIIALYKPTGVLSHPMPARLKLNESSGLFYKLDYDFDEEKYINLARNGPDFYLLHRLDRDTSGIILISTNKQIANHIKQLFKQRLVHKDYYAIVIGTDLLRYHNHKKMSSKQDSSTDNNSILWEDNMIINKHPHNNRAEAYSPLGTESSQQVKRAITKVEVLAEDHLSNISHLKLTPLTGFTHQLRFQCAHRGFPILGDDLYGPFQLNRSIFQQLQQSPKQEVDKKSDKSPRSGLTISSITDPWFGQKKRLYLHAHHLHCTFRQLKDDEDTIIDVTATLPREMIWQHANDDHNKDYDQ